MKFTCLASLGIALLLGVAAAQSSQPAAPPAAADAGAAAAQMALARRIVLHGSPQGAHACATCHGEQGQGQIKAAFPHLAGLPRGYLVRQL
ncbi:MAG: c-type cytochrome, partial [Metallibacterium sp.]